MLRKIKDFFLNKQSEKQVENNSFLIPVSGQLINLDEVPDEVFSQKIIGDGFAINPEDGDVFSPVDGLITGVFPTKHAISLKDNSGVEILIHFGLDTVTLNGKGFTTYVEEGSIVKAGDLLLKVDIDEIKDKVPSIVMPVIFVDLNGKTFKYNIGKVVSKQNGIVTLQ
ncbi:PTS glucose transporter subunit IIA [Clostridium sp. DJ247]|uniref:PTS sugar transporter subunit IIA n=1 Tax=Clostridium sp. DJ247 TaxID=2726188 RepID=UPI001625339F|nr:PTS glucose transporter subunit IIA [Clostridium sp. DJ247]MBC2579502.1 PTS glucose transporter subunit IIA [Clostridium sp. DJ247]